MIKLKPHQSEAIIPNSSNPTEAINYIKKYIKKHSCENMSVDISFMNVLDACMVSTLCSTEHYIKYPKGQINWKISSELVREFNESLELGNSTYSL